MLIAATLNLGRYQRLNASRKGGLESHRRLRDRTDSAILNALKKHGPMKATEIAAIAGYDGWRGIRRKLPSMIARELIVKRGRYYEVDE